MNTEGTEWTGEVEGVMSEVVYDMPIGEVVGILEKSDRQVRRYVKANKLQPKPLRIDGHVKLMFNRDEVLSFKERLTAEGVFGRSGREVVVNSRLTDESGAAVVDSGDAPPVKYVIDALREQIKDIQHENRDLHYQLEQRSGQVGFLQGKVEALQEELKMLMPAQPSQDEIIERKPWYKRLFGRG